MNNSIKNELAVASDVPNGFLNAAQRKIIIDWIIETERANGVLVDASPRLVAAMRKELESMPNAALRYEMKAAGSATLIQAVRNAANG